ncbi:hypothetical protein HanIR_Chr12g0568501 [Helianthus annuus]|nr:hypothetical protein HanIR_Chr12g0568501 [Helianthus annuus]
MVWLKTFKLSALGRQPEDVELLRFNSRGCNGSSVGMFGNIPVEISANLRDVLNRFDHRSCITTNTADLLIRLCLVLILCPFVYIHV